MAERIEEQRGPLFPIRYIVGLIVMVVVVQYAPRWGGALLAVIVLALLASPAGLNILRSE